MRTTTARAITWSVVALLACGALRLTNPIAMRAPGERLAAAAAPVTVGPVWRSHTDTLGRGESLRALLARGGVSGAIANQALVAATALDERRIPAGMPVTVRGLEGDSLPSEIVFQLAVDRLVRLTRTATGWTGAEERLAWTTDTIAVAGTIGSTLYAAMDAAAPELPRGARSELVWSLADIFEYRVDMSRELQEGDAFRVLVERRRAPGGVVRLGNVLAAAFTLSGDRVEAIRFGESKGRAHFYDAQGKSLRAAFLRAPVEFRRISSVFGMRRHPILGTWKAHKGTDYAASQGTPVRAIGEGVVIRASWYKGYGNCLEIRHRNGYVTRYGHLRGFARGVRPGTRVDIGQTVAYVGTTGLSTAPHLHFEVLVGGAQRDPRVALADKTGFPIESSQRAAFSATRARLVAALDREPTDGRRVAAADLPRPAAAN